MTLNKRIIALIPFEASMQRRLKGKNPHPKLFSCLCVRIVEAGSCHAVMCTPFNASSIQPTAF